MLFDFQFLYQRHQGKISEINWDAIEAETKQANESDGDGWGKAVKMHVATYVHWIDKCMDPSYQLTAVSCSVGNNL